MTPRLRLVLALLLPIAAGGLQWLLWENWIKPYVWFLFFPVAFFSAWLGGLAGGIGGTLISALLVWYVFIPLPFSFTLQRLSTAFSIMVFIGMGCLFSWFHDKLRRALSFSEGRFEATFEQVAVGIALVAPNGRFLRVNLRLSTIVGYSPEELMARTFHDITHPDDLDANLAYVRRALTGEIDTFAMEKRYIRKDGSIVWVKLTVALSRKPGGAPDYFIVVIEDISGRKRAEQRFRQLFEQAPVALATSDREGNLLLINEAFIDLFGYHVEEIPTVAHWRTRVLPDAGQRAAAERDRSSLWPAEQPAELVEQSVLCRDGSRKTVLLSRLRLGDEMMLAAIDISQRKAAEIQLRERNAELERFDRASIDRELQMIVLKRQVNEMARELGREPPYDLSFADTLPCRSEP
ncbi:MAG: PAS domain S-box protein [Accumulibacter sp.]|jgi:PAS domain S-box-containing protein|uniref:PAS domain S-box protein n=1 Tax=Accumulibacter sp. TaxID=2053492 RepID=UPI002FC2C9BB